MLTRTQIKKDLIANNNGQLLISREKIKKLYKMGDAELNRLLKGCTYDERGTRAKLYYVDDVADRLTERRAV